MICIIDSGLDQAHPEFTSQFNISGTSDPGTGDWFTDENSHGTHVAGTIAALANGEGVVGVLPNGVTSGYTLSKCLVRQAWSYSSGLVAALDACEAAGSNVVSMSLGGVSSQGQRVGLSLEQMGGGYYSLPLRVTMEILERVTASYDSVMSVAAVDANNAIATFSQQNDQVEIAAPGVAVKSTVPRGSGSEGECRYWKPWR